MDLLRKEHPETRITFSTNSITLQKQLVKEGKGVAVMPDFMVKKELARGQFTELHPKKKFEWDMMIIKRKSQYLNQASESFLEKLSNL